MKTSLQLSIAVFSVFLVCCSSVGMGKRTINPARPGDLSYRKLLLLNYDQMTAGVRKQIKEAKQDLARSDEDPDLKRVAFNKLKTALKLIFSRPDSDNMVAKLVPEVRRELALYSAYYSVINELAQEGIQAFDPSLGVNTITLATYGFMLQNLMGEIQAEARDTKELQQTLQMVADANIRVPPDVVKEKKLAGMFSTESPSEQAKSILKKIKATQN